MSHSGGAVTRGRAAGWCAARWRMPDRGTTRTAQRALFGLLSIAATLILAAGMQGAALAAIATSRVASGLDRPVFVTAPPGDPRLFIVEQRGVIKVLKDGSVLPAPFLDIDALIPDPSGNDERGLLGLAFDPSYAANGRFYVYYVSVSAQVVMARYRVSGNPDVADPASAEILLAVDHPLSNHNGGTIAFGPRDGFLYLGLGDGGGAGDQDNHAQNPLVLLGKMLRIDVSGAGGYTVPSSNPFAGNAAYRPEIWALGVRNPYRYCFDRQTGDLWIADVGQDAWEEIDFQRASSTGGENYGWRLMEGNHCYNPPTGCGNIPGLTLPIHEYSHADGCSITGGNVYRGSAIPGLAGTYFFADYCSGTIWSLRYDGQNVTEFTDRTAELAPGGGLSLTAIDAFGEDSSGEMYIVDRGGASSDGEVYKIVPAGADSGGSPPPTGATGLLLSEPAPNPLVTSTFLRLEIGRPGDLAVEIVDTEGRVLLRPAAAELPVGTRVIRWNGNDSSGRAVPAGRYFVRAALDGRAVTRSVTVVR